MCGFCGRNFLIPLQRARRGYPMAAADGESGAEPAAPVRMTRRPVLTDGGRGFLVPVLRSNVGSTAPVDRTAPIVGDGQDVDLVLGDQIGDVVGTPRHGGAPHIEVLR